MNNHRGMLGAVLLFAWVALWGGIPAGYWQPAGQANLHNTGSGPMSVFLPVLLRSAAQAGNPLTITQSQSHAIVSGNSIACHISYKHAANAYLREFALADFGILGAFQVQQVEFGVERADAGSGASQPGQVRLYRKIDPTSPLTYANLTALAAVDIDIPDMALTRYKTPIAGTAPAGSVLVVELFTPDGRPDGHTFFIGSNPGGQSGPTYIAAADCNAPEPTDTAQLGYPNMHVVMNVTGIVTSAAGWSAGQGPAAVPAQIRLSTEAGSGAGRFGTRSGSP